MKKLVVIILSLALSCQLFAQERSMKNAFPFKDVYFGVGVGFGFFYPTDVNTYISTLLESGQYTELWGTTDIYMNFNLKASLKIYPVKSLDITVLGEACTAPKLLVDYKNFYFTRYSIGALANYHIYFKKGGGHSFFLGGGALYHSMSFTSSDNTTSYDASKIAPRVQVGISLGYKKINPVINFAVDFNTKANARNMGTYSQYNPVLRTMTYSGFNVGLNVYF